jgi:hypothetical protein
MNTDIRAFNGFHLPGDHATYPIAQLAGRLAVLLLLAGGSHAASSRLPRRPASCTLEHVQLRIPGL